MTAEKLETVHGREMVYAVITNMEAKLDQEQPFETLKKEQQYVYTLWFFVQTFSQGKGMCQFFREFEKPLTALIIPALMELDEPKLTGIVHDAYNAFDENNETSSSNQQTVCALDEAFENEFDRITFYEKTEQYIRSNLNCFLDV